MSGDYGANLLGLVEQCHGAGALAFKVVAVQALEAAGMRDAARLVIALPLPARIQAPTPPKETPNG